ncbi:hypothetical protein OJ253_3367 [Cryptosporidium canis]|uniref:Uncharacterized protein n=1 Tax=Cryptosporidium canis TaxID=195482 RepID=A0A9D5DF50_9CRYT|nr:hypothetical protein OJ253_3367 [Cryptosporidium canis]
MFKAAVIDSCRYSKLIDEKLKLKSKERLRPSNLFSETCIKDSETEIKYFNTLSENICKNMPKNISNKNKVNLGDIQCLDNIQYNDTKHIGIKRANRKSISYEKEQENKLEEFIKGTSAREQKLLREFSTGIILGDEDNSREKMMSYVSSVPDSQRNKNEDETNKYKLLYPSYSNIFNDEFLIIHGELSKEQFRKNTKINISGDECAAMLLTPDTLKYYSYDKKTRTYSYIKNTYDKLIPAEYNLDNVIHNFTPQQKNLSSKLHGSDFYNMASIRNSEKIFITRFYMKNITPEIDEKKIQDAATSSGAFVNQISLEFDPIKWSCKGTATGNLRYSGDGFELFKKKLLEQFKIEIEIIDEVQEDTTIIKSN